MWCSPRNNNKDIFYVLIGSRARVLFCRGLNKTLAIWWKDNAAACGCYHGSQTQSKKQDHVFVHVHPISQLKRVEVWQIISQWMIQMWGEIPSSREEVGVGPGCSLCIQSTRQWMELKLWLLVGIPNLMGHFGSVPSFGLPFANQIIDSLAPILSLWFTHESALCL